MPEDTAHQENTFEPLTSQEALDRIVTSRLARERAKYADYEELKGKAARLDQLEAESKSELQREQERNAGSKPSTHV